MNEQTQQQHSGSGDNVNGNKIMNIIRDQNVTNLQIENADKLRPEDEKEFGDDVARHRIKEYRNILNRIDFHCDLEEFTIAKDFIQQANIICHNHHIILSYNALCIYALSNIRELTKDYNLTDKIIKLLNKAKELNEESKYHTNISISIANNFYLLLKENLIYLKNNAPKNWRRITTERKQLYYKAIVKLLFRLETCFEINHDIKYLKAFVNNLCGQEGYPWINIAETGQIDFGSIFLGEPTIEKLRKLEKEIRKYEPNYNIPEILYGDYFDKPLSRKEIFSLQVRQRFWAIISISIIILAFVTPLLLGYEFWEYIKFFLSFIFIAFAFQPFGKNRLNLLERISRSIHRTIIFKSK